jgi:hypothetical protein
MMNWEVFGRKQIWPNRRSILEFSRSYCITPQTETVSDTCDPEQILNKYLPDTSLMYCHCTNTWSLFMNGMEKVFALHTIKAYRRRDV